MHCLTRRFRQAAWVPRGLVSLGLLSTLAACEADSPAAPDGTTPVYSVSTSRGYLDYDDRLALLTQDLPGFAGFYVDQGRLLVRMKDGASSIDEAREKVGDFLAQEAGGGQAAADRARLRVSRMETVPAEYDFAELHAWYSHITGQVLPLEGISWADIDERENMIVVGVRDLEHVGSISSLVARLPIPANAVEVRYAPGQYVNQADLQGSSRPVLAGVQIEADGECTLGFNADRWPGSDWYFVTAAHCLLPEASIGPDAVGQPTDASQIGIEAYDPPFFTNAEDSDCPVNKDCKYSDVVAVKYTTSSFWFGQLAWPTNPSYPTLYSDTRYITAEGNASQGADIVMIGKESGQTTGEVLRTCVDIDFVANWLICGWTGDYSSQTGDSGAPIVTEVGGDSVRAVGVHKGFNPQNPSEKAFSATSEWQSEVSGGWCVTIYCAPDPHLSVIYGGPDSVPGPPPPDIKCSWSVTASGGVPPYSITWSGVASGQGSTITDFVTSSGTLTASLGDLAGHTDSSHKYITVDASASLHPNCEEFW